VEEWGLPAAPVLLPGDAQTSAVGRQYHILPVENRERRSPLKALEQGVPQEPYLSPL
jgi:hypothetical protein